MSLIEKSPYSTLEAFKELAVLDSSLYPKHNLKDDWFKIFDFTKYPFQQFWLNPRLSVYHSKPDSNFIFKADSLSSHPDIAIRQNKLIPLTRDNKKNINNQSDSLTSLISVIAEFESIEASYFTKQLDVCMYLTLQSLTTYPDNSYLASQIAKIFLSLHQSKDYDTFRLYIDQFTTFYPDRLKQINNFLFNLNQHELAELAYHFLNKKPNFNPEFEEHYYLLWRASEKTGRPDMMSKIEAAYKNKYNKKLASYPDPFAKDIPPRNEPYKIPGR